MPPCIVVCGTHVGSTVYWKPSVVSSPVNNNQFPHWLTSCEYYDTLRLFLCYSVLYVFLRSMIQVNSISFRICDSCYNTNMYLRSIFRVRLWAQFELLSFTKALNLFTLYFWQILTNYSQFCQWLSEQDERHHCAYLLQLWMSSCLI